MCAILSNNPSSNSGTICRCNRCMHTWITRGSTSVPRSCPSCRSILWNRVCYDIHCMRCGYDWVSTSQHPVRCPGCHTSCWDTPVPAVQERKVKVRPVSDSALADRIRGLRSQGMSSFEIARSLGVSFQMVRDLVGPDQAPEQRAVRPSPCTF